MKVSKKISENEEIKQNRKIMILTIVVCIFVFLFGLMLCFFSIKRKENYVMHYSDSSELDYTVSLKENGFYNTPTLPKDRVYISSLIDSIQAKFDYKFEVLEDILLEYNYSIQAKVLVEDTNGKKIFDQDEILVDKKRVQQVKNRKFSISEVLSIDYDKYNDLASSFLYEYDLSANAKILLSMYVEVAGTTEKFESDLHDEAVVSFEIPLTAKTTEINMKYDLTNNLNEVFQYGKTSIVHPLLFSFGIFFLVFAIGCFLYRFILYITSKSSQAKYQDKLKKIFKNYGSYISQKTKTSNSKDIMYTVSLRVELVNSFDDLINVRDSIEKPILFYESVPGEQAVFYVIDAKVSYIYVMSVKDFETKKKRELGHEVIPID